MFLLFATLLACIATLDPPATWPASGCEGGLSGDADHSDRSDRVHLRMDDDVRVMVYGRHPRGVDCSPAVVVAPPGFEWGQRMMDQPGVDDLVAAGVAAFSWDPRGRGRSEGEEDVNGHRGQDDLAQVLRHVANLDGIDPTRVVLASRSFGGALAAGALGRHDDLAVAGWVDVESPGYLEEDLLYAPDASRERMYALVDADDPQGWWAEREPAQLIVDVTAPYHRFQALPDHALGERTAHAAAMLDAAGQAEELRYNGSVVQHDDIDVVYVREHAIDGGMDPDDPIVTDAILAYLDW